MYGKSIYLTPSIIFAAHPRYSTPWKNPETRQYYQMVLQCRVNPKLLEKGDIAPQSLLEEYTEIDPNFDNDVIEWVIRAEEQVAREDLVCYGIMIRVTPCHPEELPCSHWWSKTVGSASRK